MVRLITIFVFSLFCSLYGNSQIEFHKENWAKIVEKANQENKLIFLDAYAVWCGPCKMMDRQVFSDPEIGDFFNENFINAKIDMEKGEGPGLRQKYQVTAYPTLLFINGNGELVHKTVGFKSPDALRQNANTALRKDHKVEEFEARYEKGERDPEFMLDYIIELKKAEKSTDFIANKFFIDVPNLESGIKSKIAFEALESIDSKLYELVRNNKTFLEKEYGKEMVEDKIFEAALSSIETAVKFQTSSIFKEALEKTSDFGLEDQKIRKLELSYYSQSKNESEYLKVLNKHIKKDEPDVCELSFITFKAFIDSENMQDFSKQIFIDDYKENISLNNFVIGLNLAIGSKDQEFLEKVHSIIKEENLNNTQELQKINRYYLKAKQMI
ncbi:thioredoxin family protein [Membranihabitans maritimus]|uniref:thioredoxin family protein n=1 Tax=Membranihabitans maritimus TaxID=2904244 RepID=UPI001F1C7C76|nr:thioredoxin domain-containing protein [Membranihabitans maritimus]